MLDAFLLSLGVVFVAELGDKSQLMALAFASRYRPLHVLIGISVAALLIQALSVALGATLAAAVPTQLLALVGGVLFLVFAVVTLREAGDEDGVEDASQGSAPPARRGAAIVVVGSAFLVAELGDKTMLATIALASRADPLGTWLGSSAGMILAGGLAIVVGSLLGARLPERAVRLLAALAFFVFGVVLLAEAAGLL